MALDRIVITVDGLAGSGKTTLSRELAKRVGFVHLNTGLLYRALAWLAVREGCDLNNGPKVAAVLAKHSIDLVQSEGSSEVCLDGISLGAEIRTPEISESTSKVAKHPEVRKALLRAQREAYPGSNLVAEGRDMGTVVFPDAQLKFFVEANAEVRADRRMAELGASGEAEKALLREKMRIEIQERDHRDITRADSPTVPAKDAIIIDNSLQKLTEVVQNMYDCASQKQLFNRDH